MTIVARKNSPFYYVKFQFRNRQVFRSTGVERPKGRQGVAGMDEAERAGGAYKRARAAGKRIYERCRSGREEQRVRAAPVVTVGRVLEVYEEGARVREELGRMSRRTWKQALGGFLRVLREVSGQSDAVVRGWPMERVNRGVVVSYQNARLQRAVGAVAQRAAHVSINSQLRQARGVFARWALDVYQGQGLVLPMESVEGFLRVPYLREEYLGFQGIGRADLERLDAAGWGLREVDVGMFRVFLLMRYAGLRNKAVFFARRDWIVRDGDRVWIEVRTSEDGSPKTAAVVPLAERVVEALLGGPGAPGDYVVLPGVARTEGGAAYSLVYRRFSAWCRQFFPKGSKSAYMLRKIAGSEVLTAHGTEAAAHFLGNSPQMVRRHYGRYLADINPLGQ